MVALYIHFPAGRYHATPWGRSVNEAAVAWPPEPWRILRALIATWHRKGSDEDNESTLESLIDALASELPCYFLPEGIHTHTRHYMPVNEGKKIASRLIFDAFIRLPKDQPMIISWEHVSLEAKENKLLHNLAPLIGYLGRSESWVRVVPATNLKSAEEKMTINCWPIGEQATGNGEDGSVVSMLAPLTAGDYAKQLPALRKSTQYGKRKKEHLIIDKTLGNSLMDAISNETADIQAAGWSKPPGSRRVLYLHREFESTTPRLSSPRSRAKLTTARFVLAGRPRPRVEDSVRIGELMRCALMKKSRDNDGQAASVFVGRDNNKQPRRVSSHTHAFYLPEDADEDGCIDHVLIYAEDGFDSQALRALDRISRIYERSGGEWRLALEGIGMFREFERAGRLASSSCIWISTTPYLMPWYRKKNFGPREQVLRECKQRGYPTVKSVKIIDDENDKDKIKIGGRYPRPVQFHRFRKRRGLMQPDRIGRFVRIVFAEPPERPVALGFGCHFGLGLFQACEKG